MYKLIIKTRKFLTIFLLSMVTVTFLNAEINVKPIETDPSCKFNHAISGDVIVWQDDRNGYWDIYMRNISTGFEKNITEHSEFNGPQTEPSISGNRIVWKGTKFGYVDIYMYDITTGLSENITKDNHGQSHPSISGDRIIWRDFKNGSTSVDIFMYDLSAESPEPKQITNTSTYHWDPVISGDTIVWWDNIDGNYDVYMYDIPSGLQKQLTSHPSRQMRPSISGNRIVWQDDRDGGDYNYNIYMYDILKGAAATPIPVTSDSKSRFRPSISGDKIVWQENRDGNNDIFMFDILTGSETQISSNPIFEYSPKISGDIIIWVDVLLTHGTYPTDDDVTIFMAKLLTPQEEIEEIISDIVDSGDLSGNVDQNLLAKIEKALEAIEDDSNSADGKMEAFMKQVNALVNSGKITQEEGDQLIDLAKEILGL